jgi:hypothetical protein
MKLIAACLLLCATAVAQSFVESPEIEPHAVFVEPPMAFVERRAEIETRVDYWTPRHKVETALVTGFHLADAVQTCWHMSQHKGWNEVSPLTPNNCAGASVAILGEGFALQYGSHKLAERARWWRPVDRTLPYFLIGLSVDAIRCSNIKAGCASLGGLY